MQRSMKALGPWRSRAVCTISRIDRVPKVRWVERREQDSKAVSGLDSSLAAAAALLQKTIQ